jgi:antitoxin MazE
MQSHMQTQIVQIGNSLGVRLPKALLDSLQLKRATELSIHTRADAIVLRAVRSPRAGWSAAFAASPVAPGETDNLWGDMPVDESWE